MILEQLQEISLQCDIKKYKFHTIKMMYLKLIVFQEELKMNSIKVEIITN